MREYEPNMVISTQQYNVVGTRPIRHDGPDKVTGRASYGADITMPGLLHGKILRSIHAHARIKSIDASQALALPGVKAVVTSADLPEVTAEVADIGEGAAVNYGFYSRNVMAREKALYRGHAIAAVAATSPHIAEEALSLIRVEYEVLPPVLNADEAMKDDAPVLHDRLLTMSNPAFRPGGYGDTDAGQGTNIANHFEFRMGDVEKGFQEADVVVERELHTRAVHQGYIEPHSATALWSSDGNVTIWCSTQQVFGHRDHTSNILGGPRVQGEDSTLGDRRRIWRQGNGRRISGAGGRGPISKGGCGRQAHDEPSRGVRRNWPHVGDQHPREDGRHKGGAYHRRGGASGI